MDVKITCISGSWREVADNARTTVGMEEGTGFPSKRWIHNMLLAEHSPIRSIHVSWKWTDLPTYVSTHFVRHKIGIEHWVRTQRTDRTGTDRSTLSQVEPIEHSCEANAQAIMTISRKRLCKLASKETQEAWNILLNRLQPIIPDLVDVCVPECVYRGFCPEMKNCGYSKTKEYEQAVIKYRGDV